MAYDLEAIKKKLAALNGQKTQRSNINLWKPVAGPKGEPVEYRIRVLPWPTKFLSDTDGPFIERSFYYIGDERGFLAPKQFGKEDPVEELIQKLHKSGDKFEAKKLYPKGYAYVAIIVRGEEDQGVKIWKLNKTLNTRLLGFFVDEDGGDITDPVTGCDLKVTVFQTAGKQYADTTVDMRKNSALSTDAATAQKWLDEVPNIEELFERQKAVRTTAEIRSILDNWLHGAPSEEDKKSVGTSKGNTSTDDELDKLVEDVAPMKKAAPKAAVKVEDDEDDAPKVVKKSSKDLLDDAFAELDA